MLALDEQRVRRYWCMFEFKCVFVYYTYDDPYLPSQLHARVIIKYAAMTMANDSTLMQMLIGYMERYPVRFGRTVGTLV